MSCRGLGACGCGEPGCAVAAWWFAFGRVFYAIGLCQVAKQRYSAVDDEIDYWREHEIDEAAGDGAGASFGDGPNG